MDKWPKLFKPQKLNEENVYGEVFRLPEAEDDKPALAVINDQDMLLFTRHRHFESYKHKVYPYTCIAHTIMYRTKDGGRSWECCGHMPMSPEFSATVLDGVVFLIAGPAYDLYSKVNEEIVCIFRSEDMGETWEETRLTKEFLGLAEEGRPTLKPNFNYRTYPNRNLIKLNDGSIAYFVNSVYTNPPYTIRLRSEDKGKTWEQTIVKQNVDMIEEALEPPLTEAFFFRTPSSNRLLAVSRINWANVTEDCRKKIPYCVDQSQEETAGIDQTEGLILLESKDEGLTWDPVRGIGWPGMMYSSVVYINDRDLLLTYTNRISGTQAPYPHIGVQAVLGHENEDGTFTFDLDNDIIIIDGRTPDYSVEGGGYGFTYRLSDGSLITSYSYRVVSPELDAKLQDGTFNSDETFWRYYRYTNTGNCASYEYFRNGSHELQKHLIAGIFALEQKDCRLITEVLRWNIDMTK